MTRQPPRGRIDPDTSPGAVRLVVADLPRVQAFYEQAVGLGLLEGPDEAVRMGAGERPIVELIARPDAPPRPPETTGLFHLAIVVPSRVELARALRRVADAGQRLTGASDHLVSEALYLRDPEGNGIEIYRDRPREQWRYVDGELQMDTLPLDLDGLIAELAGADPEPDGVAPGTRIGHVHLHVADLGESEPFYGDALGFDVTVRSYPGALFLSAGGYHHHIGLNTWAGEGAPPPPADARGLRWVELVLPNNQELERAERRLLAWGLSLDRLEDSLLVADSSRNRVLLKSSRGAQP